MSADQFQALCGAFCELTGSTTPQLVPDEHGLVAFNATLRGYATTFMYVPPVSRDDCFLLFDAGPMSPHVGETGWKVLMRSNLLMFGPQSPVICANEHDHVIIQRVVPLLTASGHNIRAAVTGLADWADQWHGGKWLPDGHAHIGSLRSSAAKATQAARI